MRTVESIESLRTRIERFLRERGTAPTTDLGGLLGASAPICPELEIARPTRSIGAFLDFIVDAMPDGDVYIFGGILRDFALLGRRGFRSDLDLVVEGQWAHCVRYLKGLGAKQNKFGGFRLVVAGWPVDIWNAEATWAIRQGHVTYRGISSLIDTTVLNWDAILMNWRTKSFVHRAQYLHEIRERILDVVLVENPNPLGMAVRVFRHLCLKDARKITQRAAAYLADATAQFSYEQVRTDEIRRYGTAVIEQPIYRLFASINSQEAMTIGERYGIAAEALRLELNF